MIEPAAVQNTARITLGQHRPEIAPSPHELFPLVEMKSHFDCLPHTGRVAVRIDRRPEFPFRHGMNGALIEPGPNRLGHLNVDRATFGSNYGGNPHRSVHFRNFGLVGEGRGRTMRASGPREPGSATVLCAATRSQRFEWRA